MVWSKYLPAEPGVLGIWPLEAAVANAAPFNWAPEGGRSAPQIHLIHSIILLLLLCDVLVYHRSVSTYGRDEVPFGPEVLPYKIALLLALDAGQVDRTLALDKSDRLRNRVFCWNRDHHVNLIRHEMAFFDRAFLLQRQLGEDIAEMRSQLPVQGLAAALGNKHNMIFALPLAVA